MELLKNTNIRFMAKRKLFFVVSACFIGISILSIIFHRGLNLGIDFLGGYQILLEYNTYVKDMDDIRKNLDDMAVGNFEVKRVGVGQSRQIQITIEKLTGKRQHTVEWVVTQLRQRMVNQPFQILGESMVGPRLGRETSTKAIWAIIFSLLSIIIYVWVRFEFWFGVSGVLALFHDVLVTLGVFSLLNWEITVDVVAALLTIVGYSINDTIVIFDRIRENLKTARREEISDVIDRSVNNTLSRTIITSVLTLIVCIGLAVFGGSVLRGFSVAMCVGIISGSYSTIYVASPLMVVMRDAWERRRLNKLQKKIN